MIARGAGVGSRHGDGRETKNPKSYVALLKHVRAHHSGDEVDMVRAKALLGPEAQICAGCNNLYARMVRHQCKGDAAKPRRVTSQASQCPTTNGKVETRSSLPQQRHASDPESSPHRPRHLFPQTPGSVDSSPDAALRAASDRVELRTEAWSRKAALAVLYHRFSITQACGDGNCLLYAAANRYTLSEEIVKDQRHFLADAVYSTLYVEVKACTSLTDDDGCNDFRTSMLSHASAMLYDSDLHHRVGLEPLTSSCSPSTIPGPNQRQYALTLITALINGIRTNGFHLGGSIDIVILSMLLRRPIVIVTLNEGISRSAPAYNESTPIVGDGVSSDASPAFLLHTQHPQDPLQPGVNMVGHFDRLHDRWAPSPASSSSHSCSGDLSQSYRYDQEEYDSYSGDSESAQSFSGLGGDELFPHFVDAVRVSDAGSRIPASEPSADASVRTPNSPPLTRLVRSVGQDAATVSGEQHSDQQRSSTQFGGIDAPPSATRTVGTVLNSGSRTRDGCVVHGRSSPHVDSISVGDSHARGHIGVANASGHGLPNSDALDRDDDDVSDHDAYDGDIGADDDDTPAIPSNCVIANPAELAHILNQVDKSHLVRPSGLAPTIARMGKSVVLSERYLRAFITHVTKPVAMAVDQGAHVSHAVIPPGSDLSLDQSLVLQLLWPALVLQHPVGQRGRVAATVNHRLDLCDRGAWTQLFREAGLFDRHCRPTIGTYVSSRGSVGAAQTTQRSRDHASAFAHAQHNQSGRAMNALRPSSLVEPSDVEAQLRSLHPPAIPPVRKARDPTPATRASSASRSVGVGSAPQQRADHVAGITTEQLRTAISNAPWGVSAGNDGYRFDHLKLCTTRNPRLKATADECLQQLAVFCSAAAEGKLPSWYSAPFATARVTLLGKPSGGFRPIACGSILRRLTGAAILVGRGADLTFALGQHQLGVAVPNGVEGTALAVRQAVARGEHVLALDSTNAFNAVSRELALEQCKKLLPWLSPLADFIYAHDEIPLHAPSASGGHDALSVASCQGVQQGCPLASLLFALALRPALLELRDSLTQKFGTERHRFTLVAYCDDVFVCGSADVIRHTLTHWPRTAMEVCCLQVNLAKTNVYPALPSHSLPAGFDIVNVPSDEGITVVGVPVGSDAYVVRKAAECAESIQRDFPLLVEFAEATDDVNGPYHAQAALLTLVRAVAQRANYRLRVVNPSVDGVVRVLRQHDAAFRQAGCDILGIRDAGGLCRAAAAPVAAIAALPFRKGGVQWRSMADFADVAYLAGAASAVRVAHNACTPPSSRSTTSWLPAKVLTKPLSDITLFQFGDELGISGAYDRVAQALCAADANLGNATNDADRRTALHSAVASELSAPAPKGRGLGLQRALTAAFENASYERIHDSLSGAAQSVLQASSTKGAYAFGVTAPSSADLCLTRRDLRIAVMRRVQVPVIDSAMVGSQCQRCKKDTLLADGSHAFACSAGNKHMRHDRLAKDNVACARSSGASARGASCADVDTPHNPNSAPDVFLTAPGLVDIVTDVSWVISERAHLSRRMADRAKVKHRLYAAGARSLGKQFTTFIMNNMGGIAAEGLALLKSLSRVAADGAPDADVAAAFTPYWTARFSVLAQRIAGDAITWSLQPWSAHERWVGNSRFASSKATAFDDYVVAHAPSLGGNAYY